MKKYLVGGAVRNILLNLPVKERDWVVIGRSQKDMLKKGYKKVGKYFPVFIHPISKEEYALARREKKYGYGYKGFKCNINSYITLEEDLKRRDLTINAIAQDKNGNFIDPYKGILDIKNKILRHVSLSFIEDPLRILRIARFSAELYHLNFKICSKTLSLIHNMKNELIYLTPERIWKETKKALKNKNSYIFFENLKKFGALEILFPEINFLFNSNKKRNKFKIRIKNSLYYIAKQDNDISLKFAFICYQINKILDISINKKLNLINNFCNRLKVPNCIKNLVYMAVKYCPKILFLNKLSAKNIINLFNNLKIWNDIKRLNKLILIIKAEFYGISKNKNKYFKIENLIKKIYLIANQINVNKIIIKGFTGKKISEELNKKRIHILIKNGF